MTSKERLSRHYDRKYNFEATGNVTETVKPARYPRNRYEAFLKFFPSRFRGGDICEIGAGSGLLPQSLLQMGVAFDSYTITEFSTSRLDGMQRNLSDPRIRVIHLDADDFDPEALPRFDAVVMIALIEHLVDPLGAMQRVRRLLKPGGFVYIDTPNIAKFTRRVRLLLGYFPSTASYDEGLHTFDGKPVDLYDEGHVHYFTYRALSKMVLEYCGFARVEKFGYCLGPRLFGHAIDDKLAGIWPEMFSELALIAHAPK